jgi:hypothetical protein
MKKKEFNEFAKKFENCFGFDLNMNKIDKSKDRDEKIDKILGHHFSVELTKEELREEIISNQYYLIDAVRKDDKQEVIKRNMLINNLVKIYLR